MGVRSPRGARPSLSIPIACYRRHDGPQQGEGADQTACHNGQGPTLRPWATCHPTHDRPGGAQYKGERPEPLIPPLGDEDGEDVEDDSQSRHAKRGSCLQGVLTRYAVRFFMGNGIRLFSVRHCPSLSDVSTMSELYSMRPDREQKAYKWRLRGLEARPSRPCADGPLRLGSERSPLGFGGGAICPKTTRISPGAFSRR